MRHRVNKIKFKGGKDANDMLVRKIAVNFLLHGKIKTTLSKAKVAKRIIEKIVSKAKIRNEANKNFLLRKLADIKIVNNLFENIGPAIAKINGGFVKITRLGARLSDGTEVAQLIWAYPIVKEKPKELPKVTKSGKTSSAKEPEAKK